MASPEILQLISSGFTSGNKALSDSVREVGDTITNYRTLQLKAQQIEQEGMFKAEELRRKQAKEERELMRQQEIDKILSDSQISGNFDPIGASNQLYLRGHIEEAQKILTTASGVNKEAVATRQILSSMDEKDREEVRKKADEVGRAFGPIMMEDSPAAINSAWEAALSISANAGTLTPVELQMLARADTPAKKKQVAQQQLLKSSSQGEQLRFLDAERDRQLQEDKFRAEQNDKGLKDGKGNDINTSDELFTSILLRITENQRNHRDSFYALTPAELDFFNKKKADPAMDLMAKLVGNNLEFGMAILKDRNKAVGIIKDFTKTLNQTLYPSTAGLPPTAVGLPKLDTVNKKLQDKGYPQVSMTEIQEKAKKSGTSVEVILDAINRKLGQ